MVAMEDVDLDIHRTADSVDIQGVVAGFRTLLVEVGYTVLRSRSAAK